MKKYILVILMCFPMISFGAPSVRALGGGAIVGTSGATVNKITPVKAGSASSASISNAARVGSLRAKVTTVGAPSAVSGSTGRFPVISSAKVYNTAATPRPVSSISNTSIINAEANLDALTQRVTDIEDLRGNTNVVKMSNLEGDTAIVRTVTQNTTDIQTNKNDISDNKGRIKDLEDKTDTVLVSNGSGLPDEFSDREKADNRAWIWVEE